MVGYRHAQLLLKRSCTIDSNSDLPSEDGAKTVNGGREREETSSAVLHVCFLPAHSFSRDIMDMITMMVMVQMTPDVRSYSESCFYTRSGSVSPILTWTLSLMAYPIAAIMRDVMVPWPSPGSPVCYLED